MIHLNSKISDFIRRILPALLAVMLITGGGMISDFNAYAKTSSSRVKSSKKRGKASTRSKKRKSKRRRTAAKPVITTLWTGENGEWIHKGRRDIIIHKDSTGTVRAMTPFTINPHSGRDYAQAINDYARALSDDGVRVYSLLAPTQGEYYMPDLTSTRGAEQRGIEVLSSYLDPSVTPVYINDVLAEHIDEEIYNRTDHHWSPLGAHYAASALAKAAGVNFLPLESYSTDTLRNYVGTMYKFSGDPAVKDNPEEFVWYIPPTGYKAEFINYTISNNKTVGESEKHEEPFFRRFSDGSAAAYCTFMGGDYRTAAVSNTGGTPGRRLLIVKDSYGNAMASNLFGSFEEVHVIDFRYFPHNLVDYVRENGITDLCFVNCTSLAFAANTAARLRIMFEHKDANTAVEEPEAGADDETDEETETEGSDEDEDSEESENESENNE
ncbi:MAG: hypothetical protein K2K82_05370 [Muribaculaceae bacterium]|nr:hypothetical protein [Muribaculaceae bacterium]